MMIFRQSRFMVFTNMLLALVMLMSAVRSEANCSSMVSEMDAQSQTMGNCSDMDADLVDSKHPSQTKHSDEVVAGICRLGCPVSLTLNDTGFSQDAPFTVTYLSELSPLMVGIMVLPQTPPPRMR